MNSISLPPICIGDQKMIDRIHVDVDTQNSAERFRKWEDKSLMKPLRML